MNDMREKMKMLKVTAFAAAALMLGATGSHAGLFDSIGGCTRDGAQDPKKVVKCASDPKTVKSNPNFATTAVKLHCPGGKPTKDLMVAAKRAGKNAAQICMNLSAGTQALLAEAQEKSKKISAKRAAEDKKKADAARKKAEAARKKAAEEAARAEAQARAAEEAELNAQESENFDGEVESGDEDYLADAAPKRSSKQAAPVYDEEEPAAEVGGGDSDFI